MSAARRRHPSLTDMLEAIASMSLTTRRVSDTFRTASRVCPGCGTSIDTHVDRRVCGYDHADPNERDPRDDRHDDAMDRAKGER